jgi:FMN phosphatase YigB (HAD superfamily)
MRALYLLFMLLEKIAGERYVGLRRNQPCKNSVVQAFDFDDTITMKPEGFDNSGMTKDDFFDASRSFPPNPAVLELLQLLARSGDRIAIATARPPERLQETIAWLDENNVPFDSIMHSNGDEPSGVVKQEMLLRLQDDYKEVGTLFDDSQYNCDGAKRQGIPAVHIKTNVAYWDANPEYIYTVNL